MEKQPIEFTEEDRRQLLSFVFKELLELYAKPVGSQISAHWAVARGIGDLAEGLLGRRDFHLYCKKDWHVISRDQDGRPAIERPLWTVWAYEYERGKEKPFATREETKTLLFPDLMIDHEDVDYIFLREQDTFWDD
jgi:hypothetical protein